MPEEDGTAKGEKWQEISEIIWTPQEPGDSIEGYFGGSETFQGKLDKPCQRWFLEGEEGIRYSLIGGQALDRVLLAADFNPDVYLKLTWMGKKDLGGSKSVNLWRVQRRIDT